GVGLWFDLERAVVVTVEGIAQRVLAGRVVGGDVDGDRLPVATGLPRDLIDDRWQVRYRLQGVGLRAAVVGVADLNSDRVVVLGGIRGVIVNIHMRAEAGRAGDESGFNVGAVAPVDRAGEAIQRARIAESRLQRHAFGFG